MTRIAHISDVHFGRDIPQVVKGLIEDVHREKPDLVILSGDFTQRALATQYAEARRFISALPKPAMVVPGNHDAPLYNLVARIFFPLRYFRNFISRKTEMAFVNDDVAVIALDSSRAFNIQNGRLSPWQIRKASRLLKSWPKNKVKIIVTHHPYAAPTKFKGHNLIGNASAAITEFSDAGADLFLSGHLHISFTCFSKERYPEAGRNMILVSCGTSTSDRSRGEPNSYNMFEISEGRIKLHRKWWDKHTAGFVVEAEENFERDGENWKETERTVEPGTLVEPSSTEEPPPQVTGPHHGVA